MKQRCYAEALKLLVLMSAGILYYIIIVTTGFKIPCPFYLLTGYLCPGCGTTRMVLSALRFDFSSAFGYNKALFCLLPFIIFVLLSEELKYIKTGKRAFSKASRLFFLITVILLIAFGVVRNII